MLAPAASLYVVGRGLGLGIAAESALKLKETSALHAEALSAAELRHGPRAVIEPGFPCWSTRSRIPPRPMPRRWPSRWSLPGRPA